MNSRNQKESKRILSLDVFRGVAVVCLVLMSNSGIDTFVPLEHAGWIGMTPCDIPFPIFLYVLGISTYLSLRKYEFKWSQTVARKIAKRTILIFLIGIGYNWLWNVCEGDWGLNNLRIMGVLQRIALCYCAVSLLTLTVNHKYFLHISGALLIIYSVILLLCNGYNLDETNIAARVDKAILGANHLYKYSPIDPEGLFGTISAIAHTLIGFWCGRKIMLEKTIKDKVMHILLIGTILVYGGYLLSYWLPLNKCIWSPSYVLLTCGLASLLQGMIMYVIDIRHRVHWIKMLLVFGANPLFLYIFNDVLSMIGWKTGMNDLLYDVINIVVTNSYWASLCYSLTYVAVCGLVGWWLYKRKIFIKI